MDCLIVVVVRVFIISYPMTLCFGTLSSLSEYGLEKHMRVLHLGIPCFACVILRMNTMMCFTLFFILDYVNNTCGLMIFPPCYWIGCLGLKANGELLGLS